MSITVHTKASLAVIRRLERSKRRPPHVQPVVEAKVSEVGQYGKQIGFGAQLYAVLDIEHRIGGPVPTEAETAGAFVEAKTHLQRLPELADGTSAVPDERITNSQFRILRSLVYGIDTFAGLFNTRQLFVLGRLAQGVREAYAEMLRQGVDQEYARALTTYLALLVDRIADYNEVSAAGRLLVNSCVTPSRGRRWRWYGTTRRSIPLVRAPATGKARFIG